MNYLDLLYCWGDITLTGYLIYQYPVSKYTIEDCRDWDPAQLGF